MEKINQVLDIFKSHYSEWEQNPKRFESGYQYEQTYADMMQEVEKEIFALSVGDVPKDKNKKKLSSPDLES